MHLQMYQYYEPAQCLVCTFVHSFVSLYIATVGWSCVFLSIHVVVQCAAVVIREFFLGSLLIVSLSW